jgi:phosphoserine phosphatase
MNKSIIAFDFDRTLTDKDTLFNFFLQVKTSFRIIKIILYLIAMVMAKLKIISNTKLKVIGILFFLSKKSKSEIERIGEAYAKTIKLNTIYYQYYTKLTDAWIISASFYEYLQFIFPKQRIIASRLQYDAKGLVEGLAFNCYKDAKLIAIQKENIYWIDVFYTDNPKNDESIIKITNKTFLVSKGKILK